MKLNGHINSVHTVGFSPDGTCIVSGCLDSTIRMWDARTGEELMNPLKGHSGDITSVGFFPNGADILSAFEDKTIRIWDARIGKDVVSLGQYPSHVMPYVESGSHISSTNSASDFLSDLCFVSPPHSDGWNRGSHQELLLWVLPEWHGSVQWDPFILIIGSRVQFGLKHYVHGLE